MKTNRLTKTLLAALLLAAAPAGTRAASLLGDGNFDNLPAGTAPDVGVPAGHWFLENQADRAENVPSQVSIAPAPAGGTGNALRYSLAANENPGESCDSLNTLARPVTAASGQIIVMSFDIYVEPGAGGVSLYLGTAGQDNIRTAQLMWYDDGTLKTVNAGSITTLLGAYPRGVWQTVRLKVDLVRQRYDFDWSEKGQPVSVTRSNLTFASATPVPSINQLAVRRFVSLTWAVQCYLDNIQISAGPPAAVMPAQSIVAPGGSVTLSPTNTLAVPSSYQWQFHGTNLPGATSSNLVLSNLSLDRGGPYSVVVSNAFEVVTAIPAQVQVVDQLTLISEPAGTNVFSGSNITLRVVALSPLPITYQWHRNGSPVAGATNPTLTIASVQLANEGLYTVVVSDPLRSFTTQAARLTVYVSTVITLAPISQSVVAGGSVTFSVEIDGNPGPFEYEWRRTTNPRFTNRFVLDEKRSFFTLPNVTTNQAGNYAVVVRNAATPTGVNRSFTLTLLADTDGDGLPDAWETAHGLSTTDAADAALDSDGDGLSNLAEHRAGTSPTNAASCLKIEGMARAGGQATLSFNAVSNQTYTVDWCADLSGGPWTRLADVSARTNSRLESVTDPAAGGAARFYRVGTPRRP